MLLRTVNDVYIYCPAIVWIDGALYGNSTCRIRTSTGELFTVPAAEARRVLGVKRPPSSKHSVATEV